MRIVTLTLAGGFAGTAAAETIHGALVFARHGDRTTKHYGAQKLTDLGAQQLFQVGSDYRTRYLASGSPYRIRGISEFLYDASQIYASAPDQSILLNTATAFLQGLYPPLAHLVPDFTGQSLSNGSSVSSPLTGYQYVTLHGVDDDSPEAVWIKGDDGCPVRTRASDDFKASAEFRERLASTADFYRSLHPALAGVSDYASADSLSYAKAYDIYDLINVQRIYDSSSAAMNVTDEQMFQLRTLADSAEFGLNFNASQPARSLHAATLAGAVLKHLTQTVSSPSRNPKFTLLAGSYDTFLAFFGLTDLTAASPDFFGLPHYASTMAFELFTAGQEFDAADLRVRFLFRNGTEGALTTFPLFGSGKADLSWQEFSGAIQERSIRSPEEWCSACQSNASFCVAYDLPRVLHEADEMRKRNIAVVVVACVSLVCNLVAGFVFIRKARRSRAERPQDRLTTSETLTSQDVSSIRSYEKESV
ncbi:Lysosomal acid phosphatase [Madurella fahalii]|uniref:Lysosomal acid phosphatase n=1 Tax=Madurella fahalii TaxID=1157608 RepID=A0ABQ0GKW2_9PEZI